MSSSIQNDNPTSSTLLNQQLSKLINQYLDEKPHMSVGAISRRCQVSEPTLRRIKNGQVKTLPTVATVVNLLHFIFGTKDLSLILEKTDGALKGFLSEMVPQTSKNINFDPQINEELSDSVKYLAFKLSANSAGITLETVIRLFGHYGVQKINELIDSGLVIKKNGRYFYASQKTFTMDPRKFNDNFKWVANYISSNPDPAHGYLNPFHLNYSESVSPEAYKSVAKIMKKSLKKVREICEKESSKGEIPLFLLSALDSLDSLAPYQVQELIESR